MLAFLMMMADEQYRENIERLFKRYHNELLRVAKRIMRDHGRNNYEYDAEDVVQNTFVNIVRYSHTIPFDRSDRRIKGYVYSILYHEIDKVLAEPELFSMDFDDFADIETAEALADKVRIHEHYEEVVNNIRQMEPRYSTTLMLHYCHEMSVKQIAAILGLQEKTIYSRLRRGRQLLIDMCKKGGELNVTDQ